jgi:hypothetical protein
MPTSLLVRFSVLLPLLGVTVMRPSSEPAPAKVRVTLQTLHAAALTAPRAATDSTDGPYFLVSILGPRTRTESMQLPASGHFSIKLDEAIGARPLIDLSLQPGDTVRLLVSVLEGRVARAADESAAAIASTAALSQPAAARAPTIASALAPVTKEGAHWLGSATMLLTNEGGATFWHSLECVATCKVLSGVAAAPLSAPASGVVELTGSGATYHMALRGQQQP